MRLARKSAGPRTSRSPSIVRPDPMHPSSSSLSLLVNQRMGNPTPVVKELPSSSIVLPMVFWWSFSEVHMSLASKVVAGVVLLIAVGRLTADDAPPRDQKIFEFGKPPVAKSETSEAKGKVDAAWKEMNHAIL